MHLLRLFYQVGVHMAHNRPGSSQRNFLFWKVSIQFALVYVYAKPRFSRFHEILRPQLVYDSLELTVINRRGSFLNFLACLARTDCGFHPIQNVGCWLGAVRLDNLSCM